MAVKISDDERARIVQKRADDSQEYFERTAHHSWLRWVIFSSAQLFCAGAIPVVSAVSVADAAIIHHTLWSITTAILGSAIVVLRGLDSLAQNHETWLRARATEQSLKAKVAFESRTTALSDSSDIVDAYAVRVEQILSGELQNWVAAAKSATPAAVSGGATV